MDNPKIYTAISNAMAEIGVIGKGSKNQSQGFMYRGIDIVMNVLQPVLINNKIFVVPEVLEHIRENRETKSGGNLIYSILKIKYTFYADDGSSVYAIVDGESMDSADKSSNKAMSVAFKYACFQVFCIPTEEIKDPDADTHNIKPIAKPQSAPTPQSNTTPPVNTKWVMSDAQRGRMYALIKEKKYTPVDLKKWLVDDFKIASGSSKDMSKVQYDQLCTLIEKMGMKEVTE